MSVSINFSTANTLSPIISPGQNILFPTITNSTDIFTFGNFQIQRPTTSDNISAYTQSHSFSNYATLSNFSADTIGPVRVNYTGTSENELNVDPTNPNSFSYYGSFYTKISRAINSVIETFPYAILSSTANTFDNTVFNYTQNTDNNTSNFNIPLSSITNQGNIIYASGVTDSTIINLYNNFNVFTIQFSGTANTQNYEIINYNYMTGTTGYMDFTVNGFLLTAGTTSGVSLWIRPSPNRYSQYQRSISNLEYQVGFDGTFKVPDADNDSLFVYQTFTWPTTIDGFSIDSYGTAYNTFQTNILNAATSVDQTSTAWMTRALVPENLIELDTDTQIFQKLISVYGEEFDSIKAFIDNLAYMHTVRYDNMGSVPDKFMYKLSRLLGLNFHDAFSNADIFEYFLTEDDDGKTLQDYNYEIWRKILTNIVWLYKKKGTRDALMFLFKVMGAPDSIIEMNEYVYQITPVNNSESLDFSTVNPVDGYPNYNSSNLMFQQGGTGRGNGQAYINQFEQPFEPLRTVDNVKIYTGDTTNGTRNILNSKELDLALSPAQAIESDVLDFFKLGFGQWNWSTTGITFSGLSVPFEWQLQDMVYQIVPPNITGMTIAEWTDFLYCANVNPVNRKTVAAYESESSSNYISLKKIYMTYMLWTNNQESNRLTFGKLEYLLELLERNFFRYMIDFVPATSVICKFGSVYRNTIFNRQRFIYKEGVDVGSMFQIPLPPEFDDVIDAYQISANVFNNFDEQIDAYNISSSVFNNFNEVVDVCSITSNISQAFNINNQAFTMSADFHPEILQDFSTSINTLQIINYTTGNTIVNFSSN